MSKFFCTLSMFVMMVAGVVASIFIQVPCPLWISPIMGHCPLGVAICFIVLAVLIPGMALAALWAIAYVLCEALRGWMGRA